MHDCNTQKSVCPHVPWTENSDFSRASRHFRVVLSDLMSSRRSFLVPLGTAILSALGAAAPTGLLIPNAEAQVARSRDDEERADPVVLAPPVRDDALLLAHKSHSSHRSHSSHHSGNGSRAGSQAGDGTPTPKAQPTQPPAPKPAPKPTPPPAPAPAPKPEPSGCNVAGESSGAPAAIFVTAAALLAGIRRRRRDD